MLDITGKWQRGRSNCLKIAFCKTLSQNGKILMHGRRVWFSYALDQRKLLASSLWRLYQQVASTYVLGLEPNLLPFSVSDLWMPKWMSCGEKHWFDFCLIQILTMKKRQWKRTRVSCLVSNGWKLGKIRLEEEIKDILDKVIAADAELANMSCQTKKIRVQQTSTILMNGQIGRLVPEFTDTYLTEGIGQKLDTIIVPEERFWKEFAPTSFLKRRTKNEPRLKVPSCHSKRIG